MPPARLAGVCARRRMNITKQAFQFPHAELMICTQGKSVDYEMMSETSGVPILCLWTRICVSLRLPKCQVHTKPSSREVIEGLLGLRGNCTTYT